MKIIHAVSNKLFGIKIGHNARSRCGKIACVSSVGVGACVMIDADGNQFYGSTHAEAVTCKKCINLLTLGTIHDKPSRTADTPRRAVPHARGAAPRKPGAHARPQR